MTPLPWFRFYHETLGDQKFDVIAKQMQYDPITVLGIWTFLLCLAAKSPIPGVLCPSQKHFFTSDELANTMRWNEGDMQYLMDAFIEMDMIYQREDGAYCISNWDKRQYLSDSSAERTKEYRKRLSVKQEQVFDVAETSQEQSRDSYVTSQERHGDNFVTPSDTDTESDTDKNININAAKKFFNLNDAEKIYIQTTGFPAVPREVVPHLENILDMLQRLGFDETRARLNKAWVGWCSSKRKDNGKSYSKTNPAWIDYAVADESLGPSQELSRVDRNLQELEKLIKGG